MEDISRREAKRSDEPRYQTRNDASRNKPPLFDSFTPIEAG